MRKLNSIIFGSLLILANISGCGMSGPLYQSSEKQANSSIESKTKDQQTDQQEQ
jgi:predicted small lipoprotein YifL